jgi:hypothetical protein
MILLVGHVIAGIPKRCENKKTRQCSVNAFTVLNFNLLYREERCRVILYLLEDFRNISFVGFHGISFNIQSRAITNIFNVCIHIVVTSRGSVRPDNTRSFRASAINFL